MDIKFLQDGDIIEIKEGMEIYAPIPEKFVYSNRILSKEYIKEKDITVGKQINNSADINNIKSTLTKKLKQSIYSEIGAEVSDISIDNLLLPILEEYKEETLDTRIFSGEYIVVKTETVDGTKGKDSYPSGYKVQCKKLNDGKYDENGVDISFFQSGCFTAIIESKDIQPIRNVKKYCI